MNLYIDDIKLQLEYVNLVNVKRTKKTFQFDIQVSP